MQKSFLTFLVIVSLLIIQCTNEALRSEEKFSRAKKYAIVPFDCKDMELSNNLVSELTQRLLGDDFQIIEPEKFDELLAQKKLTRKAVTENYTLAIGQVTGIDGIIIGNITLDKKSSEHQTTVQSTSGGNISYISNCSVMVIDIRSSEVLAKGVYNAPSNVLVSGS